jgi:hypothetical protein
VLRLLDQFGLQQLELAPQELDEVAGQVADELEQRPLG